MLHRCQERHYRVGNGIRGAPGQVMTRAVDKLQAGVRQRSLVAARGGAVPGQDEAGTPLPD